MNKLFFGLSLIFLFACKNNNKSNAETASMTQVHTPVQLNETVMALESSLEEPMLKAEAEIKVRSGNNNMAGVIESARAMEDTIQKRIDILKSASPVGAGGEDFKTTSVRYFEYLKSIYTTYREMAEAKNDAVKSEKAKQMENIIKGQSAVMSNLQQAQQKYAVENGFVY